MNHTEYECTILNIDLESFKSKLEILGAENKGELLQRRYVYDYNPVENNKWIRLRTNGKKTTLTLKEITDKTKIGGTEELEIEVSDFDGTNQILEKLGYVHRNYQENKRHSYILNGVSIEIDSWPLIPTYVEVEGSSESEVLKTLEILGFNESDITTLDVESIYREIYGIDILSIKELKF
mgnify:CR=1 FL=1